MSLVHKNVDTATITEGQNFPPYSVEAVPGDKLGYVANSLGVNCLSFSDKPGAKLTPMEDAVLICNKWNKEVSTSSCQDERIMYLQQQRARLEQRIAELEVINAGQAEKIADLEAEWEKLEKQPAVGYSCEEYAGHGSVWDGSKTIYPAALVKPLPRQAPLYARPVPARTLTDEAILKIQDDHLGINNDGDEVLHTINFARAVLAAVKEE